MLLPFLEKCRRAAAFQYNCARSATLKNAIEALGVPHTEVGALMVNGEPATLQRIVREGDVVEVASWRSGSDPDLRFARAYVRALKPEAQLAEVAARYGLAGSARPFSLCLNCNLPLQPIDKTDIAARVPPDVYRLHEHFVRCPGCGGVFWPGSHYRRMLGALAAKSLF